MAHQKFTVFLIPDEDGYQVIVPHYPNCTTWGKTPEEAFRMAKEAMEMILESEAKSSGDAVPENAHTPHVIVGTIDVKAPEILMSYSSELTTESPINR